MGGWVGGLPSASTVPFPRFVSRTSMARCSKGTARVTWWSSRSLAASSTSGKACSWQRASRNVVTLCCGGSLVEEEGEEKGCCFGWWWVGGEEVLLLIMRGRRRRRCRASSWREGEAAVGRQEEESGRRRRSWWWVSWVGMGVQSLDGWVGGSVDGPVAWGVFCRRLPGLFLLRLVAVGGRSASSGAGPLG